MSIRKPNAFKDMRALPAVLWGVSSLIFFRIFATKIYDPDLWWHMAAGREMVAHRTLLSTDIFSHTFFGVPWINFEWLAQIILYGFYEIAGFGGLFYGRILIGMMVLGLLVLLLRPFKFNQPQLLLLTWLGFLLIRPRVLTRPELATLLLFPLVVLLLLELRKGTPQWRKQSPWIFFGLMVLWVNLHGGFIYGFGTVALLLLGSLWAEGWTSESKLLARIFLYSLFGILINPYGYKITNVLLEHLFQLGMAPDLIQEWKPTGMADAPLFWILFIGVCLILCTDVLKNFKRAKRWIPVLLIFGLWGTHSFRNTTLFAFVALPYLVEILEKKKIWIPAAWILCFLPVVVYSTHIWKPFPTSYVAWNRYPVQASRFIETNNIDGTLYNSYGFGGYLEWRLGPQRKVFMDGRYLFHPILRELTNLNENIFRVDRHFQWPGYLEEKQIDYAVVEYPLFFVGPLNGEMNFNRVQQDVMFPEKGWALVHWDDTALVFVRRVDRFKSLISESEYKYLSPHNLDKMRYNLIKTNLPLAKAQKELEMHKRRVGYTVIGDRLGRMIKIARKERSL